MDQTSYSIFIGSDQFDVEEEFDFTHALVFWLNENKYSVVSKSDILLENNQKVLTDREHYVMYSRKPYKAMVKFCGSKPECDRHLDLLTKLI